MKPYLAGTHIRRKGRIIIGTVKGDLRNIGKNLVILVLESNGLNVVDLGVAISTNTHIGAARHYDADTLRTSSLLTMAMTHMPEVVEVLKQAGLKSRVRVIIGGAPITREFADSIGVEVFANNCVSPVDEATRLMAL